MAKITKQQIERLNLIKEITLPSGDSNLSHKSRSTKGISLATKDDIASLSEAFGKIWDFGGQQSYEGVHQFFYKDRTAIKTGIENVTSEIGTVPFLLDKELGRLELQKEGYDLIDLNRNQDPDIVVTEAHRIREVINEIYKNNSVILELPSRKFEQVIAELLHFQGFEVSLTKQTRDNGYDILALRSIEGFPLKFLVECKRYKEMGVGVDIIRGFNNVISRQNANKGIIVTTSYFTKDAIIEKELTPYLLDFRDKIAVLDWVHKYTNGIK